MKKALLLLFVTPLCPMNNKRTFDQTHSGTVIPDKFEDIYQNTIIPEETIPQKTAKVDSSAMEKDPQQLCQDAVNTYCSITKTQQNSLVFNGDVPTLIAKTYVALRARDSEDAARWYAYFEERAGLDFPYLGENQQQVYGALSCYLSDNVDAIQPENVQKIGILEQANRFKNETESWIELLVTNNTCTDMSWRTLLAPDDQDTVCLSPKTLRNKRLETISKFGTFQEMVE